MLTFIRCLFHPRVTAVARKRPLSFCQKCRWQGTPKHELTLDPTKSEWADYAAVQAYCGNLSGNEFTRTLSENIRPQSSQLAELLWTDPGIKSGIRVFNFQTKARTKKGKKRKKAQTGNDNILPKSTTTCLQMYPTRARATVDFQTVWV